MTCLNPSGLQALHLPQMVVKLYFSVHDNILNITATHLNEQCLGEPRLWYSRPQEGEYKNTFTSNNNNNNNIIRKSWFDQYCGKPLFFCKLIWIQWLYASCEPANGEPPSPPTQFKGWLGANLLISNRFFAKELVPLFNLENRIELWSPPPRGSS